MSKFSFKTPFVIHGGFLLLFIVLGFVVLIMLGLEGRIIQFTNDFMSLKYFGLPTAYRLCFVVVNWFSLIIVFLELSYRLFYKAPIGGEVRAL